jgi:hypothetical protein
MATTSTFDGPLPGGSDGAAVRVHPLVCAQAKAPVLYLAAPGGGSVGTAKAVAPRSPGARAG